MDQFLYEARSALRSLRRRPGFTVAAALTLALGIGANAAIFAVVRGVLLQPLPYDDPDGLIVLGVAPDQPGDRLGSMSQPDFVDLERESDAVVSLVGHSVTSLTLTGMGEPATVQVDRVSKGLLSTLGISAVLGRDIREDESGREAAGVAVISHAFWQEHYAGATDALGRTFRLNGLLYEVIGVAPPRFDFPGEIQIWVPRQIDPDGCARGCHTWRVIGRLADGSAVVDAQVQADRIAANLEAQYPDTNFEKTFEIRALRDQVVGSVRGGLWILFGAVAAVLLIACANVANLLLARASARRDEMAVRAAVGASPRRLAAGLIMESGALAILGGVGGIALAGGGVAVLRRLSAGTIPRVEMIAIDGTVLAFALALVVLVTFLFGLSPALQLARTTLSAGLRESGRGSGSGQVGRRYRTALTAVEMALSVLLLIGAGLLLRTFAQLYAVELGFETREIVRFSLSVPSARYTDIEQVRTVYRTLEGRIEALPGVEAVGSIYGAPLGRGNVSGSVLVAGRPEPEPWEETEAAIRSVSPGYLETLRIRLLRGRLLEGADDASDLHVAVVNETFVRENFPDEEPLGKQVRMTVDMGYGSPEWTIVGIVGDVRTSALTREPMAEIYVPHGRFGPTFMTVHARSAPGAGSLIGSIREQVRSLDSELPLQSVETVTEAIERQVAPTRFFLLGVGIFASLALLLAIIGLYGVMAYLVSRRMREIGVRVAMGAAPVEIVRLVLSDGMRPALAGAAAGVLAALVAGRIVEGLLFGVTPRDPWILAAVPVILSLVAVAAILPIAVRASRIDPIEVLRAE